MRRLVIAVAALLLFAPTAYAQQVGVLTHNATLHSGPSSSSGNLGALQAGDAVTLVRNGHRTGYLRVRTQNEEVGWVYERYVTLVDPTELHQPAPAHTFNGGSPAVAATPGDFDSCPDSGNAKPSNVRVLNRLKNRSARPQEGDIDSSVTLTAMLAPSANDEHRFTDGKAAEISGYVFRVIPGGHFETTNCKKGDPVHRDTHIELTTSPTDTVETRRVIVEVTPRWRAAELRDSVDWSTATLQQTLEGHWAKVRGWLMFDVEHKGKSENTRPGGDGNWRATAWEIHPITAITLITQP